MAQLPTVCLAMIVREEPEKVRRALLSVEPLIKEAVLLVNPGDPLARIKKWGIKPKVTVKAVPWVNHGANRTLALRMAEKRADFVLMLDADDYIGGVKGKLALDKTLTDYELEVRDDTTRYWRKQIFRSRIGWRYEGAAHETPAISNRQTITGRITGDLHYFRSPTTATAKKFLDDAAVLEKALAQDPANARNVFYLGQSYYDAAQLGGDKINYVKAQEAYMRRASMGGWGEEVFFSYYKLGAIAEWSGQGFFVARRWYEMAFMHSPHRAEPMYEIARAALHAGDKTAALEAAKRAVATPIPVDGLFVNVDAYGPNGAAAKIVAHLEVQAPQFSSDWFSQHSSRWAAELAGLAGREVHALEIGCYEGRSTCWLLQNILTHAKASITSVDTFDFAGQGGSSTNTDIEATFKRNISAIGLAHKVRIFKCKSKTAFVVLRKALFDFVYVDGSHEYRDVKLDLEKSWKMLKPGGILIADDYEWSGGDGPRRAIDGFLKKMKGKYRLIHKGVQVSLLKR